ncbi:Hsp70 family protein [Thaumasiovibrio subtropicus]|uniref:Hsp70 family protein n=1 Tax=Thaumasiovibrio subtropicus TaxID=1891207 RepID=UPI000B35549A|nr:Hsp70 family protein [Thaumasiovibrio subtropicus]
MSSTTQYFVGIDLGTTHSVIAFSRIDDPQQTISIFPIDQLAGPGVVVRKPLLPSFRYHPSQDEIRKEDIALPWQKQPVKGDFDHVIVGEWARELGTKVSGRQVTSAKSWLSHQGVDRQAAILPWNSIDDVTKVSPVIASASYLKHIHQCWNYHHGETPLADQFVVITVPASFDEAARQFTLEAARLAGLSKVHLLEEPQAACYDWYQRHQDSAQSQLAEHPLVLICDVGGGTTDLSLIAATTDDDEQLALTRIGIGEHLMLGGDNIDLSIAHHAEMSIANGKPVNAANLAKLIQQTRKCKETLLKIDAPATSSITMLGRGAKLIGGTKTVELDRDTVQPLILDGFMPPCELTEYENSSRSAMQNFGLPYAANPAISQHIANFLLAHQNAAKAALGLESDELVMPSAVIFNGGFFNSTLLKERTLSCLNQWQADPMTELDNPHPDLAVARGAVCYGFARQGQLLKIGGGSALNYFLEVETKQGEKKALALLAKGSEEGVEFHLSGRQFALSLGQPIKFNIMTSRDDSPIQTGTLTEIDDSFHYLPPLIVSLEDEKAAQSSQDYHEPVTLVSHYDELGLVKVACVSTQRNARWLLEFEIRHKEESQQSESNPQLSHSLALIDAVYGDRNDTDPKAIKTLRQQLEKQLGQRDEWDMVTLRELATPLLAGKKRRRRSAQHERNWFKLAGQCLRPGFGFPADEWRMKETWNLYQQGIQFASSQTWADWWVFWRKVSGGLNAQQQKQIFKDIRKYLQPGAGRNSKLAAERQERAYEEMVRLAACLEKIDLDDKMTMIEWLFGHLQKSQYQQAHWWAIGRIASRSALSGEADKLMSAAHTEFVLTALLEEDWLKEPYIGFAAVMMSRKTGDRHLDIGEEIRQAVIAKLEKAKAPASWVTLISTTGELSQAQSQHLFGDSLPTGLKLIG